MKRLYLWWNNRKQEDMAKRKKAKGRSVRHGNAASPYNKYRKQPYFYGDGYKDNYLQNGVLYRNGKPHRHSDKTMLQAAE